jgi:hypothetical protein
MNQAEEWGQPPTRGGCRLQAGGFRPAEENRGNFCLADPTASSPQPPVSGSPFFRLPAGSRAVRPECREMGSDPNEKTSRGLTPFPGPRPKPSLLFP